MVPPTTLGWNPDVKPWPFDPEGAKKLLAEAKADGVPVDTEITLIGRTGNFPNVTEVIEALQQMLRTSGLTSKLEMYEVAEWVQLYSKPFAADRAPQHGRRHARQQPRRPGLLDVLQVCLATAFSRASATKDSTP